MCTGRVDLAFIHRAFAKGADGVFIAGCWPGECHYITEGNYDALGNVLLYRKLMEQLGLQPERLRLEWVAASEGSRYAEVIDDFVQKLKEWGPLGQGEGLETEVVASRFEAAGKLIPYIKLVERERLRPPARSEEIYKAFYTSAETDRLFRELIVEKLVVSQIMSLLEEKPLSTAEIAESLQLNPSDVAQYMNSSSRHGLVRYDVERNCYALS